MDDRYKQFDKAVPYATELFGVYQPLLGWAGRQASQRVDTASVAVAGHMVAAMLKDPAIQNATLNEVMLVRPNTAAFRPLPPLFQSQAAEVVRAQLRDVIVAGQQPTAAQWSQASASVAEHLHTTVNEAAVPPSGAVLALKDAELAPVNLTRESVIAGLIDAFSS